jgi:integrase
MAKRLIAEVGSLTPRKLSAAHISDIDHYICTSGYAHATRKAKANSLRKILRWLWEEHGAKKLDTEVRMHPGLRPRNVTATSDEIDSIIGAAEPALRLWILLCSDLGIRSGTASALAPNNYNPARQELRFTTKYGAKLTLPVTSAIAELLRECDRETTVSFVRQLWIRDFKGHGRPPLASVTDGNRLGKKFQELCSKQGITRRITPHDLRRTAAVGMLEQTGDIRDVQSLLGHRQLQSTLWYLDHDMRPLSRATIEAIKFNRQHPKGKIA